jgi:hypothetical protein
LSSSSTLPSCGPYPDFLTSTPIPRQNALLLPSMLLLLLLIAALLMSMINACLILRRVLIVLISLLEYSL